MRDNWTAFYFTGLFTGVFSVCWMGPVMALPPDPQRPFVAQDCPAALARLAEAEAGNPLISKPEMAEVVLRAKAQAKRLCPASATDTALPDVAPLRLRGAETN